MQTTAYPTPLREFGLAEALKFWTNRMQQVLSPEKFQHVPYFKVLKIKFFHVGESLK
jgi:hypothetical protein